MHRAPTTSAREPAERLTPGRRRLRAIVHARRRDAIPGRKNARGRGEPGLACGRAEGRPHVASGGRDAIRTAGRRQVHGASGVQATIRVTRDLAARGSDAIGIDGAHDGRIGIACAGLALVGYAGAVLVARASREAALLLAADRLGRTSLELTLAVGRKALCFELLDGMRHATHVRTVVVLPVAGTIRVEDLLELAAEFFATRGFVLRGGGAGSKKE